MLLSLLSLWEPDQVTPPAPGFQIVVGSSSGPHPQTVTPGAPTTQSVTVRINKTRTSAPIKMGGTT